MKHVAKEISEVCVRIWNYIDGVVVGPTEGPPSFVIDLFAVVATPSVIIESYIKEAIEEESEYR